MANASDVVTFGISSKRQPTVIDKNFEYVKVRVNLNGKTYWRCKMPELLSYFEHTYVRGRRRAGRGQNFGPALFPIKLWNHHSAAIDGIARTTNAVEGWHFGLQSLFQCHHPTLWTFLDGLSKDQQRQKTMFLQGLSGADQPAPKKYRDLGRRVTNAVQRYASAEVLQYLRAMAHLSHK